MAPPVLRREKHLLILGILEIQTVAGLPNPGQVLQMTITNLRNRPLRETHVNSMHKSILSMFLNLTTGSKAFPLIEYKGFFSSVLKATPFDRSCDCCLENTTPPPLMFNPAGLMAPPAGSRSSPKLLTPVLPEKAEIKALKADSRNCVCNLEDDGVWFTRVFSSVYSPDGTELTNCWRVTDYSADGHILMSVLCRFVKESARYSVKRKRTDEESSSQSQPKKRLRL